MMALNGKAANLNGDSFFEPHGLSQGLFSSTSWKKPPNQNKPYSITDVWTPKFEKLIEYKQQFGHCNVPQNYNDRQLARWVTDQRGFYQNNSMPEYRIKLLEEIGFEWRLIKIGNRTLTNMKSF